MKTLIVNGCTFAHSDNANDFLRVANTESREDTAQNEMDTTWNMAGTFSDFFIVITVNDIAASTSYTLLDDGVDTGVGVSIPSTTTGTFSDTSNTTTIASGSEMTINYVAPLSGTGQDGSCISLVFEPTSGNARSIYGGDSSTSVSTSDPSRAFVSLIEGNDEILGLSLGNAAWELPFALTFSNLHLYIGANNTANSGALRMENQSGGTALDISVPGSTTGEFSDSDSVALSAGNTMGFALVAGSGDITWDNFNFDVTIENPNNNKLPVMVMSATSGAFSTPSFIGLVGDINDDGSSANSITIVPFDADFDNLYVRVTTGFSGATGEVSLYDDGVETDLTVSIPVSTTGTFSNTTDVASIAANSEVNYGINSGVPGDSTDLSYISSTYQEPSAGGEDINLDSTTFGIINGIAIIG